ncbi:hypothetical protein U1839_18480 [Sphingomonas sp. RT2P30]|uniref:hypothetical protein n=1 Tax=Parasphingomonas halimpatiens TaxID=3096162 RepID=UPI002FC892DA
MASKAPIAEAPRTLDAYQNGDGFVALFDFFDDLIFLVEDSAEASTCFYQMKSRTGSTWTPKRFTRRLARGDLPTSIVAKAYNAAR